MSKSKIVLKKLKALDKIWHPESTLVFKSLDDKKVIGRYADNEFISLDETALQLCVDWSFTYDPDLVEEASDEEEKSTTDDVPEESTDEATSQTTELEETPDKQNEEDDTSTPTTTPTTPTTTPTTPTTTTPTTTTPTTTTPTTHIHVEEIVDETINTTHTRDEFKHVIDSINSLYYSKVSAYNELQEELKNTKSLLNEVQYELNKKNTELNELQNKLDNIKRAFLQ